MADITKFSNIKVLVVDDLAGMRSQLRITLSNSGFEKVRVVPSIKEALVRVQSEKYDLILCDYCLGDSTNGQQFLEYLRTRDLISRHTVFIIITAERSYENVVMTAECEPDDYLLKPFTAEQLNNRLEKLLDRREYLAAIDHASDAKNWSLVVTECDRLIPAKDKYFIDVCKIKGAALLKSNRAQEAADLYRELLAMRPIAWAELGLAKACALLGADDQARELVHQILAETPRFMAAYDFASSLHAAAGDRQKALEVLQKAGEISPGTMNRVRKISELATATGQHDIAEQVMREALQKHKHSPVREAQDYAILSHALTEQGKPDQALKVLGDAKDSFRDEASTTLLAANESMAQRKAGNNELAEEALSRALAVNCDNLPAGVATAVADACFALGREDKATALLKQVVQNNPDDKLAHQKVQAVLAAAGKGEQEARAMIEASVKEIIQLNNDGVREAEAGQLAEAITLLCDAADRLPNNLQIVGNAALALALDLVHNGHTVIKMQECLRYRQLVEDKSPGYPKLAEIDAVLKQVSQD